MATFTSITNAAVAAGAALTTSLMTALRDNLNAVVEGDASAPKIAFAAVQDGVGGAAIGSIGTYLFAKANADVAAGGTIAGSNLLATSAQTSQNATLSGSYAFDSSGGYSGTWRAMGLYDASASGSSAGSAGGATLWLRIS